MIYSRFLNQRELCAIKKIGEVLCPGTTNLPSFSKTDWSHNADTVFEALPSDDLAGLKILLWLLSFLPLSFISVFLKFIFSGAEIKGLLGTPFRLIKVGLTGLIYTLYYSQERVTTPWIKPN